MKQASGISLSKTLPLNTLYKCTIVVGVSMICAAGFAYERYNDGCTECHGGFSDDTSPKNTVFSSVSNDDNKHDMHRGSEYMNTACDLCHTNGDGKDPYIGSSEGTTANPTGLGCTGCHMTGGLRMHHLVNGVVDEFGDDCADCHSVGDIFAENSIDPPYYGTVDTLADNPCNDVLAPLTNENWTVGDGLGVDNDGDNLYDLADFDCGPLYQLVDIEAVGSDIRITWETVGGRKDMLQAAPTLTNMFTDVGSALTIPGVGVVTTNVVETGGALSANRFYRIRYAP